MPNISVIVAQRSSGIPTEDIFRVVDAEIPACPAGGVLAKLLFAGVDPAMRGWLSHEQNYATVPTGDVMHCQGVAEIVESDHPDWQPGDIFYGHVGWQQFRAVDVKDILWRVDPALAPPEKWTSALGLNGLTSWIGVNLFGPLHAGETILVSTAAGAVGSVVGQLARAKGARVVGLTSSPDKCALALAEFGYDAMIDYQAEPDLAAALKTACPDGIDVYFDSVAGEIADTVFGALNVRARIIQCGTASIASWLPPPSGPRRERAMLVKRLSWNGMVVFDHTDRFAEAQCELAAMLRAGTLTTREHIIDGLAHAPGAIRMLYDGRNTGRLLIKP